MLGLILRGGTMSSLLLLMIFAGMLFAIPVIAIAFSLIEHWNIHREPKEPEAGFLNKTFSRLGQWGFRGKWKGDPRSQDTSLT